MNSKENAKPVDHHPEVLFSATEPEITFQSSIKVIPIRIISILNIFWGISSICIQVCNMIGINNFKNSSILPRMSHCFQIAALVIYVKKTQSWVFSDNDVICHGIWAGLLYIIAASLGLASTTVKTKGF